jgi:hypothetical protein
VAATMEIRSRPGRSGTTPTSSAAPFSIEAGRTACSRIGTEGRVRSQHHPWARTRVTCSAARGGRLPHSARVRAS